MSEPASQPKLTPDQIVALYEQRLTRTVVIHLLIMVVGAVVAAALFFNFHAMWLRILLVVLAILASGMAQRLVVLGVRCPSCGARVLGRIHSIIQARSVTRCPLCKAKLRG